MAFLESHGMEICSPEVVQWQHVATGESYNSCNLHVANTILGVEFAMVARTGPAGKCAAESPTGRARLWRFRTGSSGEAP